MIFIVLVLATAQCRCLESQLKGIIMEMVHIELLQRTMAKDNSLQRVLVALDGVGCGIGFTEAELLKRTGLETKELREKIGLLDRYNALLIRCTQGGTCGPYDYYFTLTNLKVNVTCEVTKTTT